MLYLAGHDRALHPRIAEQADKLAELSQPEPVDGIATGFNLGESLLLYRRHYDVDFLFSSGLQNQERETAVSRYQTVFHISRQGDGDRCANNHRMNPRSELSIKPIRVAISGADHSFPLISARASPVFRFDLKHNL